MSRKRKAVKKTERKEDERVNDHESPIRETSEEDPIEEEEQQRTTTTKKSKTNKRSATPSKQDRKVAKTGPEANQDGEYKIDRIMEMQVHKNGKREFLVKWAGYSVSESTWESEKNLEGTSVLENFLKKVEKNLNVGDEEDEAGENEETGTSHSQKSLQRTKQIQISKSQGHQKSPKKGASSVSKASQKKQSASKTNKNKEDGEYEVEKILTMRKKKGKREFLVRWKGYTDADDTWEPENNLSCDSLLTKFLAESA